MAYLYKITNLVNEMVYYGMIWKGGKTVEDRLEEHMNGRGSKCLYKEGCLKFGEENFVVELLASGDFEEIKEMENNLVSENLWPIGYNKSKIKAHKNSQEKMREITNERQEKIASGEIKSSPPPNWKGKKRSRAMRRKLSKSKKEQKEEWLQKVNKHPNAFGRKSWLAIDQNNVGHYSERGKDKLFENIECNYSTFQRSGQINLDGPTKFNKNCKNQGWMLFNDEKLIKEKLKKLSHIIIYE